MPSPRELTRRLDAPTRWLAFLGFAALLVVAGFTILDVLMRWLFGAPIHAIDDLSRLALAVVIVSCFPAGLLQGRNIVIRFLGAGLGRRATHWLEAFGALLTFFFFAMCAWQFVVMTIDEYVSNNTTMTIEAPTWPWWVAATALIILTVPVQAVVLIGHLQRAFTGKEPGGTIDVEGETIGAPHDL